VAKRCQQITLAIGPSSATPSAQLRRVRPATGIADPATLLPLRVAMPTSVGPCHRSRDPHPRAGLPNRSRCVAQEISRCRPVTA